MISREKVEIVYSSDRVEGKKAGQRETVDGATAKALIHDGQAVAATKPDAKAIGVDPETAATAKPKGS